MQGKCWRDKRPKFSTRVAIHGFLARTRARLNCRRIGRPARRRPSLGSRRSARESSPRGNVLRPDNILDVTWPGPAAGPAAAPRCSSAAPLKGRAGPGRPHDVPRRVPQRDRLEGPRVLAHGARLLTVCLEGPVPLHRDPRPRLHRRRRRRWCVLVRSTWRRRLPRRVPDDGRARAPRRSHQPLPSARNAIAAASYETPRNGPRASPRPSAAETILVGHGDDALHVLRHAPSLGKTAAPGPRFQTGQVLDAEQAPRPSTIQPPVVHDAIIAPRPKYEPSLRVSPKVGRYN